MIGRTPSALGIHLAALHMPFFQRVLGIEPIAPSEWLLLLRSRR